MESSTFQMALEISGSESSTFQMALEVLPNFVFTQILENYIKVLDRWELRLPVSPNAGYKKLEGICYKIRAPRDD